MKYKMDPNVLHEVAQEVVALNLEPEAMFGEIRLRIAEKYPSFVESEPRCWMGSRAGGILGKMTLLFGSMNEYLIIFGCPVASQGYSGRYNFVEIWDFYISGEIATCDLETSQCVATVYKPGDKGYLPKGHSLSCEMKAGAWMIEYGRGPIFTALPFALMDSLMSSVELRSFYLTIKEYSYFVLRSLLRR